MKRLSEKHKRFVAEYLIDLNATKAAIRAGYSEKTAESQGSRLLKNAKIAEAVAIGQKKRCDKLEITAERVLQEIAKLAFANIEDFTTLDEDGQRDVDLTNATREQLAAIQELSSDTTGGSGDGERRAVLRTKIKLADKGLNLERLGRHLKLFTDKLEVTGLEGLAERVSRARAAVGK